MEWLGWEGPQSPSSAIPVPERKRDAGSDQPDARSLLDLGWDLAPLQHQPEVFFPCSEP